MSKRRQAENESDEQPDRDEFLNVPHSPEQIARAVAVGRRQPRRRSER